MSKVLIYAADAEEAKALAIIAAPIAGGPPAALRSGGALPEGEAAGLAGKSGVVVLRVALGISVHLRLAMRFVWFGRCLAKKEDIGEVETLAKGLGAEIGCSRPIAEELKWLPQEHQVGITGAIVKPDLYIALGISGAIQHFAGMKDAKVIVAVNSNKNAPIFQFADYGIVGDIYEVVPALEQAIGG